MGNLEIIILRGLVAAGKSTWAKAHMVKNPGKYKRINKDLLREMLDCSVWNKKNESFVLRMRDATIINALNSGYSVIVDDTNLHEKHIEAIKDIAELYESTKKDKLKIIIKDFEITVSEAIERDSKRLNPVGAKVIKDMANRFIKPEIQKIKWVQKRPTAAIFDVDGCLAKMEGRSPYEWDKVDQDKANLPIVDLVDKYYGSVEVIILSGRDGSCREKTEAWFAENGIKYNHFFMRDANNNEKDSIIKQRIYEEKIKPYYNVLFVVDDRLQVCRMWHNLGLTLLRVGDPDADF